MWWIGQQLDGGHAEVLEVAHRRLGRQAAVGAAQVLAHLGVPLREALDVHLVDDRLVPRRARAGGRPPSRSAGRSTSDFGIASRVVLVVALEVGVVAGPVGHVGQRVGPSQSIAPSIAFAYGSISSLDGLKRWPPRARTGRGRGSRSAGRARRREVAVPVERRALGDLDALLAVVGVEQAQLDALACSENREKFVPSPSQVGPAGTAVRARRRELHAAPPTTPRERHEARLERRLVPGHDDLAVPRRARARTSPRSSYTAVHAARTRTSRRRRRRRLVHIAGRQLAPQRSIRAYTSAISGSAARVSLERSNVAGPAGRGRPRRRTRRRRRTRPGAPRAWPRRSPRRCGR